MPGISDHNQTRWFEFDSGSNDYLTEELQANHGIRVSLFKYDIHNIFFRPEIQIVANELLNAVSQLEAQTTMVRNYPVFANPNTNTA